MQQPSAKAESAKARILYLPTLAVLVQVNNTAGPVWLPFCQAPLLAKPRFAFVPGGLRHRAAASCQLAPLLDFGDRHSSAVSVRGGYVLPVA